MRHRGSSAVTLVYSGCPGVNSEVAVPPQAYRGVVAQTDKQTNKQTNKQTKAAFDVTKSQKTGTRRLTQTAKTDDASASWPKGKRWAL